MILRTSSAAPQKPVSIPTPQKSVSAVAPKQSGWFLLVLLIGVLTRLGLWFVYPLSANNDSPTYVQLARNILIKGFSYYNATRSPGYPAFLAVTGSWVYFAQLFIGMLTTLLFFYIGYKLSGHAWFGAAAALLHTLNIGQLFFEATLLTETLTTFCLTATLAGATAIMTGSTSNQTSNKPIVIIAFAFLTGLAAALAGITRPLFAFLPVLLFFFCILVLNYDLSGYAQHHMGLDYDFKGKSDSNIHITHPNKSGRYGYFSAVAIILPAVLIFGWWLNFVNSNYKILSFDTIGGFRWLNHTGGYFEYVPDEYAIIRDTYIKYRNAKIAQTGTQVNAVWDAMDELQINNKMGFYALSRELTNISMGLIRAHPDLYIKNVISGWWMFWWAAVYWSVDALAVPALIPALRVLIFIERGIMVMVNFTFIIGSLAAVFWKKIRVILAMNPILWLGLTAIWATSLAQALLDHGDNPRYLVPMQSMVMLIVMWWLYMLLRVKLWNNPKKHIRDNFPREHRDGVC